MVSKVYQICHFYESGVGHGMQKDGHAKLDCDNPDHSEAYAIGYGFGLERSHLVVDAQIAKARELDLGIPCRDDTGYYPPMN